MGKRGKAKEEIKPLKELAVTPSGWAMHDGMLEREGIEEITAFNLSSTTFPNKMKALEKSGETMYRQSMELTEQEIAAADGSTTHTYVIVGYTFDGIWKDEKEYKGQPPFISSASPAGVTFPGEAHVLPWEDADKPRTYVVAKVFYQREQQKGGLVLSALIPEASGLCKPWAISKDLVFYRSEFRNLAKSIRKRRKDWNGIVTAYSYQFADDATGGPKQKAYRRAQNTGKVVVEPFESLLANLSLHATAFQQSPDAYLLREMKSALERADIDLEYKPHLMNEGLCAFVQNDYADFTDEDAAAVVEEAEKLWPEVENLEASRVSLLKECFELAKVEIEYSRLPALLNEGMFHLSCKETSEEELDKAELGEDVHSLVERILGPTERKWAAPILKDENDDSNEMKLLRTILPVLRQVLAAHESNIERSKNVFSDSAMSEQSPLDIFARFRDQVDQDSARVAFFETVRYAVGSALHNYTSGYMAPLAQVTEILEKVTL